MEQTQFKVGDKVVYPVQGVAEVVRIETKNIGGSEQAFYVLHFQGLERKILVPVKNADSVGIRALIGEGRIQQIFDILRSRDELVVGTTWHKRYKGFQDMLKTGIVTDVAQVLRDLLLLEKSKSKLSFGESQLRDRARGMLVQEIAIARGQSEQMVLDEVTAIFA